MKYTALEQAAGEARAGIKEIDAEIDRLEAQRELLEVFEMLVCRVLTVLPMSAETNSAGKRNSPGTKSVTPVTGKPSFADSPPEGSSDLRRKQERSGMSACKRRIWVFGLGFVIVCCWRALVSWVRR
jgi:hypothetical protein